MLIENVRALRTVANEWNGEIITSMNYLTSVRNAQGGCSTKISLRTVPTSPFLTEATFVLPPSSIILSQFSLLERVCAPYRVSLKGVLADVGDSGELTLQGNPKKTFKIVDDLGYWMAGVLFGEHALQDDLTDDTEVSVFFASARPSTANYDGSVNVNDRAFIMILQSGCARPTLHRQVMVR